MRVLLGENQRQFGQQVFQRLRTLYDVDWAEDVSDLHNKLVQRFYTLLVLGMDVPNQDRLKLIEQCREISVRTAIILITDPVPVHERIRALEVGADDYLMRPVHLDEFTARAKALIRRSDTTQFGKVRVGNLELSDDGELFFGGTRAELQQAEHKLLSIMVRRTGRLVSKGMIDRALTGGENEELSANAIEQRISRLRKILDQAGADLQITTIRGSGYILETMSRASSESSRSQRITLESMHKG